jgi:hypothetical protein
MNPRNNRVNNPIRLPRTSLSCLYGLLLGFFAVLAPGRADAPSITVAISRSAPIETLSPSGEITNVTMAAAGVRYTLVSVQGTQVLLKDSSGTRYLVALNCTDYSPAPTSASLVPVLPIRAPQLTAASTVTSAGPQLIEPGKIWPDDRGKHIQAHGGGIIKVGDTYYWFGEDRSEDNPPRIPVVSCYASKDLAHWQFRNQVEKAADPANLGPGWILERPKVFYNAKTNKFVMYGHLDNKDYRYAHVAVFTCDTVDGDYQYLKDFRPLDQESRDIGQFIDDDGSAYLIFESRPTKGFFIAKLSDDYLGVEKETAFIQAPLEGGAVVHYNGLYYALGSRMTGWNANPNQYAIASNLEGPWSEFKDIAPPNKNTYGSQSTMLLKVVGSKTTSLIFMGDIWKPKTQWNSRYLWMPIEIGDGRLWLPEPEKWTLDASTGETQVESDISIK